MASVFLSYDRDDAAKARSIASVLEKAGHSVWWDRHIKGGAQYSKEIEAALKAADAVVVLWSAQSVDSAWVRDEAAAGRDSGRLVPVLIDGTEAPLGFRQYQGVNLARWKGRGKPPSLQSLLDAVDAAVSADANPSTAVPSRPASKVSRNVPIAAVAAILMVILVAVGLWVTKPWAGREEIVLTIGPGQADSASQSLSRDMAVKLGALQASATSPVKLVEASAASSADLSFAVTSSGPATATLILKAGRDSSILWSKEFAQPSGSRADLLQQLAYTAGRMIGCATEGLDGPVRLKPTVLKTYLRGCDELAEIATTDPQRPIPMLEQVVRQAPTFKPAWSKLLLAEVAAASEIVNQRVKVNPMVAQLKRHIAEARKIDPAMPEAALAEAQLLPATDFGGRAKLIQAAAEGSPEDSAVLMRWAAHLAETGRLRQAADVAAKASRLDPLSPAVHGAYTTLLAYSGSFDAARRELAEAEKLWPGTASLWDTQYRFHLRYGDPKIARAIFDQQADAGGKVPRLLMDARQDPHPAKIEALIRFVEERLRNMENPSAGLGVAILAYGQFGRTEEIFSTLLNWPNVEDVALLSEILFRPEFRELRRDPRFLRIAQRAGLLGYWRQSGDWPEFCHEPDLAYDCADEATKLMKSMASR